MYLTAIGIVLVGAYVCGFFAATWVKVSYDTDQAAIDAAAASGDDAAVAMATSLLPSLRLYAPVGFFFMLVYTVFMCLYQYSETLFHIPALTNYYVRKSDGTRKRGAKWLWSFPLFLFFVSAIMMTLTYDGIRAIYFINPTYTIFPMWHDIIVTYLWLFTMPAMVILFLLHRKWDLSVVSGDELTDDQRADFGLPAFEQAFGPAEELVVTRHTRGSKAGLSRRAPSSRHQQPTGARAGNTRKPLRHQQMNDYADGGAAL